MSKPKLVFTQANLADAVDFLHSGGVLAYPSESVWGVGCDAMNTQAIEQVVELKSRQLGKGLIALTDDAERLTPLIDRQNQAKILHAINQISAQMMIDNQQATTWVVPVISGMLPKVLTGEHLGLAVRITPHSLLAKLCAELVGQTNPFGLLVSTSCNRSGEPPALNLEQAYAYFGNQVGYLDIEGLGFDKPSQIIDLLSGRTLRD